MKKAALALALLALSSLSAAQTSAPSPAAANAPPTEGRVSGTMTCTRPDPMHRIDVPDWPNHAATASRTPCTWTKPAEIGGAATKDGYSVGSADLDGTVSTERGSHVINMSNGDRIFVAFRGKGMTSNGAPQSVEGTWNFKGGNGQFANLQGMGTYKGKPNADGAMVLAIEGNYKIVP